MSVRSFSIKVEWQDAPGVEDIVDIALWARMEIHAQGVSGTELVLTAALDSSTGQVRTGTYGSLFPRARWITDSYWSLLWEVPRTPRPRSGRDSARVEWLRPWVQRHCLLAAREGFSLPDLTIARDGEHVVVAAFPDGGAEAATRRPVSFITGAFLHVDRREVDNALRGFMAAVLERTRSVSHPDVERLREDWAAIVQADEEEARLCCWASRLGIDPYDEQELADRVVEFIEDHLTGLPDGLRSDILDSAIGAPELEGSVTWLERNMGSLHGMQEPRSVETLGAARTAHKAGYARARSLRREVGIGAGDGNVVGAVGSMFGFDFSRERASSIPAPAPLEALIGANGGSSPLLVGEDLAHAPRSFRWARALYIWRFGHLRDGPRLVTRSHERLQREGRAFAAELLAPAAALRRHILRGSVDDQEVTDLASAFNVSPILIRHQIENHGLAVLE